MRVRLRLNLAEIGYWYDLILAACTPIMEVLGVAGFCWLMWTVVGVIGEGVQEWLR